MERHLHGTQHPDHSTLPTVHIPLNLNQRFANGFVQCSGSVSSGSQKPRSYSASLTRCTWICYTSGKGNTAIATPSKNEIRSALLTQEPTRVPVSDCRPNADYQYKTDNQLSGKICISGHGGIQSYPLFILISGLVGTESASRLTYPVLSIFVASSSPPRLGSWTA